MLYRVVIVEDDPMVSLQDRTFTEKDPRFRVVQTFQDGQAALDWLAQNPADLVVLDRDLFETEPRDFPKVRVLETVLNGRTVYSSGQK